MHLAQEIVEHPQLPQQSAMIAADGAMLGEGMLKGLAETAKNFAGSFVSKERLTTVEYPEERLPLPEASRTTSIISCTRSFIR